MKRVALPYVGLHALLAASGPARRRVLLESARSTATIGSYSIFGYDPAVIVVGLAGGLRTEISGEVPRFEAGDPWALWADFHRQRRPADCGLPDDLPFGGGAMGWIGYEGGAALEGVVRADAPPDEVLFRFGYFDAWLVADERSRELWAVADMRDPTEEDAALARLVADVSSWHVASVDLRESRPRVDISGAERWVETSNFSREAYFAAVARIRDYIAAGDVYQVNLAQRFECAIRRGEGPVLYSLLRRRSAAPYASYVELAQDEAIVGCSPERFLRVRDGVVETRPIKGTRPRGETPAADAVNRAALLSSAKDRAELLMIVDLERNDLGRVCVPGSIRVDNLFELEEHPTVFHLVADVSGRLAAGRDIFDVLRATFPGGSITGAPKIRAMEIIRELEPVPRGVYTGAAGYIGHRGECELNVAIRTIQCQGGHARFHAGSGVVWDSDPALEYEETLAKARALGGALADLERTRS